jgi:hypothetical protein
MTIGNQMINTKTLLFVDVCQGPVFYNQIVVISKIVSGMFITISCFKQTILSRKNQCCEILVVKVSDK